MEELKNELDAKTEAHVFLCKQFNELGKRSVVFSFRIANLYPHFTLFAFNSGTFLWSRIPRNRCITSKYALVFKHHVNEKVNQFC